MEVSILIIGFSNWITEYEELENVYQIDELASPFNARQLLKRIKKSALSLGFKDYTHGLRMYAKDFLILRTKDDKDFISIELRQRSTFPFRYYLKAWNEGLDKTEFENNLLSILYNIK
jgi:hypothetical protein